MKLRGYSAIFLDFDSLPRPSLTSTVAKLEVQSLGKRNWENSRTFVRNVLTICRDAGVRELRAALPKIMISSGKVEGKKPTDGK